MKLAVYRFAGSSRPCGRPQALCGCSTQVGHGDPGTGFLKDAGGTLGCDDLVDAHVVRLNASAGPGADPDDASLDGVVEAPGGEPGYRNTGWTFRDIEFDPAAYEIKGREQEETSALLVGRVSYEVFTPIWPTMEEFAGYNAMPRYVVSRTLERDDERWPATILRSIEDVAALKQTDGGPIAVHGSASLGRALADAGLVDRYHLLVFPVLLGAGKRLFINADKDKQLLKVRESETYGNGITKLVYDVTH